MPLPFVLLAAGARIPAPIFDGVGLLLLALWGFWFYMRPLHFEVGPAGLRVRWPWRSEIAPRLVLAGVEVLSRPEVKSATATYTMRVGAGGLGGGFGLAWTRQGFLRLYVSRIDRFAVVHCRKGRDLMITPADSERFVAAIQDA